MNTESVLWAALQAFLPQLGLDLTLKGNPGKILNMSSIYGSYTLPFSVRQIPDGPLQCLTRFGMLQTDSPADAITIHAMLGGLCCPLGAAAPHDPGLCVHAVSLLGQQGRAERAV